MLPVQPVPTWHVIYFQHEQAPLEGTADDPWKISALDLTSAPADYILSLNLPVAPEVDKGMLIQSLLVYCTDFIMTSRHNSLAV